MALLAGLLIISALVLKFLPWLVGMTAAIVVMRWGVRAIRAADERVLARRQRLAGLAQRADEQHGLVMDGDDAGVYGEYPPAV